MFVRWYSTVRSLTKSAAAISRLRRPRSTSAATRSSCGVRRARSPRSAARPSSGRRELTARPLGPRLRAQLGERAQRRPQVGASVTAPSRAAQPLAVAQLGARELERRGRHGGGGEATPRTPHRSRRAGRAARGSGGERQRPRGDLSRTHAPRSRRRVGARRSRVLHGRRLRSGPACLARWTGRSSPGRCWTRRVARALESRRRCDRDRARADRPRPAPSRRGCPRRGRRGRLPARAGDGTRPCGRGRPRSAPACSGRTLICILCPSASASRRASDERALAALHRPSRKSIAARVSSQPGSSGSCDRRPRSISSSSTAAAAPYSSIQ